MNKIIHGYVISVILTKFRIDANLALAKFSILNFGFGKVSDFFQYINPCHKVILSNQSEVFKTMLSDGCGSMIEASTGEIKIKDISADTMESLLYFLYFDHENLKGRLLYTFTVLLVKKLNLH